MHAACHVVPPAEILNLESPTVAEGGAGTAFSVKALELTFHLGLKWFRFGYHPGLMH